MKNCLVPLLFEVFHRSEVEGLVRVRDFLSFGRQVVKEAYALGRSGRGSLKATKTSFLSWWTAFIGRITFNVAIERKPKWRGTNVIT